MATYSSFSYSLTEEKTTTMNHRLPRALTFPVKKFLLKLWNSLISNTKRQKPESYHEKLPFDLVAEILCRLPVKSLLRFRCVCKLWNSLISNDRSFAKKHLGVMSATKSHHIIATLWKPSSQLSVSVTSYPLDSLQLISSFTYDGMFSFDCSSLYNASTYPFQICSCDGLLCFNVSRHLTVIWNPSTRKLRELPSLQLPTLQIPPEYHASRNMDYTNYAFGYDPLIDNYKVVSVFCYEFEYFNNLRDKTCKTEVKVHTLGTHSWRRIHNFPSTYVPRGCESGIIVSGSVNWFAYSSVNDSYSITIVSLDLGKESYQDISQPDYGYFVRLTMGVMRDCLCLFAYSNSFTDVWLMKIYGNKESWIKLIRLPRLYYPDYRVSSMIVDICEDKNQVLLILRQDQYRLLKWFVYDARKNIYKSIEIQGSDGVKSKIYVESLISP